MAQLKSGSTAGGEVIATRDWVTSTIIGGAPAALDTLNELAAAIGDNASYASSITTALAGKLSTTGKAADSDKVDGYHASDLWRSDGATWNPSANISLNQSANSQEWSFDITRNGYTGGYWQVWDSELTTMLKVDASNGRVYAPYDFVGNLQGNITGSAASATTAGSATTATTATNLGSYYTADDWIRATGDNNHIKFYGNSRQMMWRTDGTTEAYSGLGGYPFVWNYNGSNSGNRIMILHTNGRLWTADYGWLDEAFQAAGSYASSSHNHDGVYQPVGSYAAASHNHDSTYLKLSGGTTTGGITVSGSLTVAKSGTDSYIHFPAQTNDPGYIRHYESNNSARMYFSVSDDNGTDDFFAFGYSGNVDRFRIYSNGTFLARGTSTIEGDLYVNRVYDRNNTGYYVDPASTNRLDTVEANYFRGFKDKAYKLITVDGEPDIFYPVRINGSSAYGLHRYSISRSYSAAAPNSWNTASHRGGLTLTVDWTGDISWGGNDKTMRVVQFNETYTTVAGGITLPVTGGMIVWLRGGGAQYNVHAPNGSAVNVVVELNGFEAGNGARYEPRSMEEAQSTGRNEINDRWPVRDNNLLYDSNNRVATETWTDSNFLRVGEKAADSNLLDGVNSTSFLRSDANDTFTGTITMGKQHALVANNYGRGVYGVYSSTKYQHVWGMGTAYNLADDGSGTGNLYGVAWTHSNVGGESISGLGHQMLIMSNGDTRSAIGDGIWTKYNVYADGGNSTEWNQAYDNYITGAAFSGTTTKTLTLTQRDGGTITASFSDASGSGGDGYLSGLAFNTGNGVLTGTVTGGTNVTVDLDGRYQAAGSYLTTSGKAADSNLLDGLDSSQFVRAYGTTNDNIDSDWGQSFKTFDPVPAGTPPIESPNLRTINIGENFARRTQLAFTYATDQAWFRRRHNDTWHEWREFWHTGNFNPASYLTTTGKAADSNLLDGINSTSFLRSDADDTMSGTLTITGSNGISRLRIEGTTPTIDLDDADGDSFNIHVNSNNFYVLADRDGGGDYGTWEGPHPLRLEADTNKTYLWDNLVGNAAYASTSDFDAAGAADAVNTRIDEDVLPAIPTNNNQLTNGAGYVTSSGNTVIGTDSDINTSGYDVIDNLYMTDGVIISHGTRQLHNVKIQDTRTAEKTPNDYLDYGVSFEFTDRITSGWHSAMTLQGWHDGYTAWQIIGPSNSSTHENWYLRSGISTTWGSLRKIWHSGNLDAFVGATVSNDTITFTKANGGTVAVTTSDADSNTWRPIDDTPVNGATGESISSNWAYDNARNLSNGGNSLSGAFTATGDITAFSDARVKENIETIDNALDKVTQLRGVEYNKIGSEEKSIGVVAQEIREVLPEVVKENEDGMLSVAYGNITGVLIEAIKEQQKQIEELKAQLDGLTK